MTADGLAVLKCLFGSVWSIFTSWHVPGTNVSPAMWMLFFVVASMGLRVFLRVLGSSSSVSGTTKSLMKIDAHDSKAGE